ncbi:MAG: NUDIX domain-containing protein [Anaerolineaceae bacterium]|nr:NUDIX domain-containing protein [Anaerolineaceae bacterium]
MRKNRATAMIIRNGKLLLIQRHRPGRDFYVLPGGGLKLEESFEEACIREVKEETGLDVLAIRLVSRYITLEKEENYYLTQVTEAEPVLGGPEVERQSADDSYAFVWVDAAQLESLDLHPAAAQRICREVLQG